MVLVYRISITFLGMVPLAVSSNQQAVVLSLMVFGEDADIDVHILLWLSAL